METNTCLYNYYFSDDEYDDNLTQEELRKIDLEATKAISKKRCDDNNINVSLIAFKKLEDIGFDGSEISVLFLSKLIEDVYHERKMYDGSEYFDLSLQGNGHYKTMSEYYDLEDSDVFRIMIAMAIGTSACETKNINDIVYGISDSIHKEVIKQDKIKNLIA